VGPSPVFSTADLAGVPLPLLVIAPSVEALVDCLSEHTLLIIHFMLGHCHVVPGCSGNDGVGDGCDNAPSRKCKELCHVGVVHGREAMWA